MKADIVVDYTFGDAGKGATVDLLARQTHPDWIVRFNGGAQAAHNVVTPSGLHHCFHQFGSGLLASPRARTYLTEHVLFDPIVARDEQAELVTKGVQAKLVVHPFAVVVTPWHVAMNRLRETVRTGRHGSCGMGIGEARGDSLRGCPAILAGDLVRPTLRKKLEEVFDLKVAEARQLTAEVELTDGFDPMINLLLDPSESTVDFLEETYRALHGPLYELAGHAILQGDYLIFEGAQGVLLDEWKGFFPHTTWTDTTPANAMAVLDRLGFEDRHVYGVLRAYTTRHGAGPLPTENAQTRAWAMRGEHNGFGPWQESFRTGWFDLPLARYALAAAGKPDSLVLTCLDRLPTGAVSVAETLRGSEILVPPSRNLSESEALAQTSAMTQFLEGCKNDYSWRQLASPAEMSSYIRAELDLPNGVDSYGPSSDLKSKIIYRGS